MQSVNCDVEKCIAKEPDAEPLRHMCQYCIRNKNAKEPDKDYSVTVKDGGY